MFLATGVLLVVALALACGGGMQGSGNPPPTQPTLRQAAAPHSVLIGTAADSPFLNEAQYSAILGTEFSQLQAEYEMKFGPLHPRPNTDPNPYDFTGGDALVAFAQAHSMVVRGHTLVWHQDVPAWVSGGGFTPPQLSTIMQDHIQHVMAHYTGKVYAWDVVNEAFNDDGTMRSTIWYDNPGIGFAGLGTHYIEQVFTWTHAADPAVKLFYNDYGGEVMNTKSDAIYAMAADFKARGVPLDGIGFQMHIDLSFDNTATLNSFRDNLQRFAALGLDLHITEMDIRLSNSSSASLNAQAQLYGKITQICLQQPKCKLIQTWGFTDKYSWIPGFFPGMGWALYWDATYQKKPAYTKVRDTLKDN